MAGYARSSALLLIAALLWLQGIPAIAGEPPNLGDLKIEVLAYVQSGAYARDLEAVDAEARAYIEQRYSHVAKPALVLDIDETALSNWREIKADNFGFFVAGPCDLPDGPCGNDAWERLGRDTAIAPTLALYRMARSRGVRVFFITGRYSRFRTATERNLRQAGYHGWTRLFMRPDGTTTKSAADFKAPIRKTIEAEGYTIVANVGDQPSDLKGGHEERAFLLPDPFYRIP
ncbi:MAG: HAD family acid phosphatase [Steroidobacteraceae bacterium]